MNEKLNAAVEELVAQLEIQLQEAAETKRVINNLRKRMNLSPLFEDVELEQGINFRADQFYGKAFATAAQEYLERKKQACTPHEITEGLKQGGFDFRTTGWKSASDWPRMIAISLAKNNVKFHKLPNGTFGLRSWYSEVVDKQDAEQSE